MSKKKGMSIEEKIEKVEAWFCRHPAPYTLKELQTLVPKATGVIYQSIEECVELLVSEGRVMQDKIGVHTLLWRFPLTDTQKAAPPPSSASVSAGGPGGDGAAGVVAGLRAKLMSMSLEALQEGVRAAEERRAAAAAERAALLEAVGDESAVAADQQALAQLTARHQELLRRKATLAASDPELLARLRGAAAVALEAANRWTDNYFLLEEGVTARMGESAASLRRSLHVPPDIDFVDALPSPPTAAHPPPATAPRVAAAQPTVAPPAAVTHAPSPVSLPPQPPVHRAACSDPAPPDAPATHSVPDADPAEKKTKKGGGAAKKKGKKAAQEQCEDAEETTKLPAVKAEPPAAVVPSAAPAVDSVQQPPPPVEEGVSQHNEGEAASAVATAPEPADSKPKNRRKKPAKTAAASAEKGSLVATCAAEKEDRVVDEAVDAIMASVTATEAGADHATPTPAAETTTAAAAPHTPQQSTVAVSSPATETKKRAGPGRKRQRPQEAENSLAETAQPAGGEREEEAAAAAAGGLDASTDAADVGANSPSPSKKTEAAEPPTKRRRGRPVKS